jgi:hypothetical protein
MCRPDIAWLPVEGYYLVVRLDDLARSYAGGKEAFLSKYPGFSHNARLAVLCSSHGMEFREIQQELEGLDLSEACFESYWDGIGEGVPTDETLGMTSWLVGKWTGRQFLVRLAAADLVA